MQVEAKELLTKETDDRGRLYLGTDKADKKITVAILEIEDEEDEE